MTDNASEYGRLLAQRDRLIGEGVDPAELLVPMRPDDELDPTAEDGEPEAPDVRTDPVEDDPDADHAPAEDA